MHRHRYVFLGPQGSGKGTQAAYFARRLGIPHLSVGDILRVEVASGSALGKRIDRTISSGGLLSAPLTNTIVKKRLLKRDARRGYILDGYPRSRAQFTFLRKHYPDTVAVHIHITDAEALRRIQQRRVCARCGAIYHTRYKRPKRPGVCDVCRGGPIEKRHDDYPAAIRRRLTLYHRETEPLVRYYRKRGRLISVDGHPSIASVRRSLVTALNRFDR